MASIAGKDIRRPGRGGLLGVCWRQWCTERALARRGICFRTADAQAAAAAYAAMNDREFEAINGRQDWANWHTIPRALRGHLPDRPLRVLDLGCGSGSSTQVLAYCCPAGSHLTGYEIVPPLLIFARRRSYMHQSGKAARVDFCCQPLTELLHDADGARIPDQSVDLVNASGVVGHHLTAHTVQPLLSELERVLHPDGAALLDVGPTLPAPDLSALLRQKGFCRLGRFRSWFFDPTGQILYRRALP